MKAMKTVEEILYKVWKEQLSVTNGSAEIVSMIEAERAKNAALVTLLTTMKDNADQNDSDDATFRQWVFDAASHRLTVNENGGSNAG